MSAGRVKSNRNKGPILTKFDEFDIIHFMNHLTPVIKYSQKDDQPNTFSSAGDVEVLEEKKVKKPSMYTVIMMNDDYTPMEFVVWVLRKIFFMNQSESENIMMKVHTSGRASCGSYTYDVAQTKIVQVHQLAERHEHPLQCQIEEAGSDEG